MKKDTLILLLLMLIHFVSMSQDHFHCVIDEDENTREEATIDIDPRYGHIKSYIPDMDSALPLHKSPIKTIKVNVHVAQKDDGSGNYGLKGDGLKDHNAYLKLVGLYVDLHRTDRGMSQLTDAEMSMVKNIADNGNGSSQSMAEAVMAGSGDLVIVRPCLTMSLTPGTPSVRGDEEISFAPIGAKWHYSYDNGLWKSGYVLMESVSDTIIDGTACRKLVKTYNGYNKEGDAVQRVIGYEYMTQINDSVMIYRYGEFMKLYDLGAEIGDTLIFPGTDLHGDFYYGNGIVVDKGTVELNGQTLRYIDLEQPEDWEDSPWQFTCNFSYNEAYPRSVRLCEKIGNISGYFLPEAFFVADDCEGGPIRCYSDEIMSVSFQDVDCDYIDLTDIEENDHSAISIFPNPTDGNLAIELAEGCHSIEIYDSFGRMMMSRQVNMTTGQQVIDVDISEYPSGLYLVVVKNDNERYYKRIVKN